MPTIIDSLILAVKLDPKDFKKGAKEVQQAQADIKQTATTDATATEQATTRSGKSARGLGAERKKQSEEERKRRQQAARDLRNQELEQKKFFDTVTGGLKSIGMMAVGAVLGFEGLKGAVMAYAGATSELAGMSRLAPTIGTNVHELNVLGNMLTQVGGKSEDAAADLAKLGHAQFSLLMHQPDAMAGFARRMGVGLFNADGSNRDKVEILKDIGDKLRAMTPDVQMQAMYAREMGLSEATIQAFVIKTAAARAEIERSARATAKVDEDAAKAAEKTATAMARLKNTAGGIMQRIAGATTGPVGATIDTYAKGLQMEADEVAKWPEKAKRNREAIATFFKNLVGMPATRFDAQFDATTKKYGLPEGMLKSIANRESHFDPNAVNKKSGARGLMQLMPDVFGPDVGKDANTDIDTAGKELASLLHKYGGNVGLALAAYNGGQGNLDKRGRNIANMKPETQAYVPAVMGSMQAAQAAKFAAGASAPAGAAGAAAGASGPQGGTVINNNTTIGEINIDAKGAKDANDIAGAIPDALKRKGVVAQANAGMS